MATSNAPARSLARFLELERESCTLLAAMEIRKVPAPDVRMTDAADTTEIDNSSADHDGIPNEYDDYGSPASPVKQRIQVLEVTCGLLMQMIMKQQQMEEVGRTSRHASNAATASIQFTSINKGNGAVVVEQQTIRQGDRDNDVAMGDGPQAGQVGQVDASWGGQQLTRLAGQKGSAAQVQPTSGFPAFSLPASFANTAAGITVMEMMRPRALCQVRDLSWTIFQADGGSLMGRTQDKEEYWESFKAIASDKRISDENLDRIIRIFLLAVERSDARSLVYEMRRRLFRAMMASYAANIRRERGLHRNSPDVIDRISACWGKSKKAVSDELRLGTKLLTLTGSHFGLLLLLPRQPESFGGKYLVLDLIKLSNAEQVAPFVGKSPLAAYLCSFMSELTRHFINDTMPGEAILSILDHDRNFDTMQVEELHRLLVQASIRPCDCSNADAADGARPRQIETGL